MKTKKSASSSLAQTSSYNDQSWQIEQDLRTMIDAAKIEKDPKRLKAVRALAKVKADEITQVNEEIDEDDAENKPGTKK